LSFNDWRTLVPWDAPTQKASKIIDFLPFMNTPRTNQARESPLHEPSAF
jgi:hypothetical protein